MLLKPLHETIAYADMSKNSQIMFIDEEERSRPPAKPSPKNLKSIVPEPQTLKQINFVDKNRKQAANFKFHQQTLQNFRQSILSKNNTQNLELYKLQHNVKEFKRRQDIIEKQKKWMNFKEEKQKVFDEYLKVKRKQLIIKAYLTHMQLLLVLKYVACAFMEARFRHERKLIEMFLNRNLANMYIKHLKRFRRDIPLIRHTQTRQVMTFKAVLINVEMYNKSLDNLKPLFLEWSY